MNWDLKVFTQHIESTALAQITELLSQPAFSECKVRIMPDVHAGTGCVIGFTANLGDKVIPNVVGVDIGCGMLTSELGNIDIDFAKLDSVILEYVPSGMNVHEEIKEVFPELKKLICFPRLKNVDWLEKSLGTLGGGNHFIEVDADDEDNKYLVIHTGSRNLGKQVADYYQKLAIEQINGSKEQLNEEVNKMIRHLKETGREQEISGAIKALRTNWLKVERMPNDLCYLSGLDRLSYLHDMAICQHFAQRNRAQIMTEICARMRWVPVSSFETVHNYIDLETNIIRKGAISAKDGERVLIPMNMRDGCIIGIGKGNEDWNCSAPHGAVRVMSRMEAKRSVSMADYEKSMDGIFTTSISEGTLDECPMAYKPMDEIVANIAPTVDIERVIKPIYNFKASES